MGAPSDQFLHLLWRPPYVFFHTKWGPSDHFFAYYIGAPRSLSSLTIWGPSDQFLLIQYGAPLRSVSLFTIRPPPPQISFFACYRGGGAPHILVFSQNIWGPPQISFSAYFMGPLKVSLFPYYIWSPLRSVSVHTFWGLLSDQFFLLL